MKRVKIIFLVVLILMLSVSCSAKADPVLSTSGLKEASFSQKDLEAIPMIDSNYTNKDGGTTVFSGVPFSELLSNSGVESYSQLSIIASDGYSATVTFEELSNCSECVLSYSDDNGWSAVMPDFPGKLQVKDVVVLNVE